MFEKMKLLVCITLSLLLFSCSARIPVLKDQDKGIVAIPLKVQNTAPIDQITYDYILKDYHNQDVAISIKPREGQKYFFSQPLDPGEYQLYKIISKFNFDEGFTSSWTSSKALPKSILFTIDEGTVSVADKMFTVNQIGLADNKWRTKYNVEFLGKDERKQIIDDLKKHKNSHQWRFSE